MTKAYLFETLVSSPLSCRSEARLCPTGIHFRRVFLRLLLRFGYRPQTSQTSQTSLSITPEESSVWSGLV
ncbi:hypothetical protein RRF57_008835 [Xylaria bambusicola]|uniref:Uncharacterized protein n=1 Tax=Xylaria bambusicola TaxID=326684 RepID=A0AAN7UUL0_9PEZI